MSASSVLSSVWLCGVKCEIFPWARQVMRCNGRVFEREIHYAIMTLNPCTDLVAIIPDTSCPGVSPVPI